VGAGSSGVAGYLEDGSEDSGDIVSVTALAGLSERLMLSCIFFQATPCVENWAAFN